MRFKRTGDIDANRVANWLAQERESGQVRQPERKRQRVAESGNTAAGGLSHRTSNFYLACAKEFCHWLQRSRRMAENPLVHLQGLNPETDIRRERRALDADELEKLLDAARRGAPYRGLSGKDRRLLYLVAAYTGLRVQELSSLEAESFDLSSRRPTVTVAAGYSKHRRKDVLPLHACLVEELRPWLEGRKQGERLWPGTWWERSGEMIRRDLERAGVPHETPAGIADFHGLRHTYLSRLASSGVHPKTIQELARHSTITLTLDRYSHLNLIDLQAGLEALPPPACSKERARVPEQTSEELRATGTEGCAPPLHAVQHAGDADFSSPVPSSPVHRSSPEAREQRARKSRREQRLSAPGASSPPEAMVSPAGLEPAACGLGNRRSILLSYGDREVGQGR
jgi:integrase